MEYQDYVKDASGRDLMVFEGYNKKVDGTRVDTLFKTTYNYRHDTTYVTTQDVYRIAGNPDTVWWTHSSMYIKNNLADFTTDQPASDNKPKKQHWHTDFDAFGRETKSYYELNGKRNFSDETFYE